MSQDYDPIADEVRRRLKLSSFGTPTASDPSVPDVKTYKRGQNVDYPVKGTVTSPYGRRKDGSFHEDVDIGEPEGTPIAFRGTGVGQVTRRGTQKGKAGNYIVIDDGEKEHMYAHLSKFEADVGDYVDPGQEFGRSGGRPGDPGAGNSTGPHVHYRQRPSRLGGRPMRPTADLAGDPIADEVNRTLKLRADAATSPTSPDAARTWQRPTEDDPDTNPVDFAKLPAAEQAATRAMGQGSLSQPVRGLNLRDQVKGMFPQRAPDAGPGLYGNGAQLENPIPSQAAADSVTAAINKGAQASAAQFNEGIETENKRIAEANRQARAAQARQLRLRSRSDLQSKLDAGANALAEKGADIDPNSLAGQNLARVTGRTPYQFSKPRSGSDLFDPTTAKVQHVGRTLAAAKAGDVRAQAEIIKMFPPPVEDNPVSMSAAPSAMDRITQTLTGSMQAAEEMVKRHATSPGEIALDMIDPTRLPAELIRENVAPAITDITGQLLPGRADAGDKTFMQNVTPGLTVDPIGVRAKNVGSNVVKGATLGRFNLGENYDVPQEQMQFVPPDERVASEFNIAHPIDSVLNSNQKGRDAALGQLAGMALPGAAVGKLANAAGLTVEALASRIPWFAEFAATHPEVAARAVGVLSGGAQGAAFGGASVAGPGAEDSIENRLKNTLMGMGVGGAIGAVAPGQFGGRAEPRYFASVSPGSDGMIRYASFDPVTGEFSAVDAATATAAGKPTYIGSSMYDQLAGEGRFVGKTDVTQSARDFMRDTLAGRAPRDPVSSARSLDSLSEMAGPPAGFPNKALLNADELQTWSDFLAANQTRIDFQPGEFEAGGSRQLGPTSKPAGFADEGVGAGRRTLGPGAELTPEEEAARAAEGASRPLDEGGGVAQEYRTVQLENGQTVQVPVARELGAAEPPRIDLRGQSAQGEARPKSNSAEATIEQARNMPPPPETAMPSRIPEGGASADEVTAFERTLAQSEARDLEAAAERQAQVEAQPEPDPIEIAVRKELGIAPRPAAAPPAQAPPAPKPATVVKPKEAEKPKEKPKPVEPVTAPPEPVVAEPVTEEIPDVFNADAEDEGATTDEITGQAPKGEGETGEGEAPTTPTIDVTGPRPRGQEQALPEPTRPMRPSVWGRETSIIIPGSDREYKGRYVLREAKDSHTSHDPLTFKPKTQYVFKNDRNYEDPANQDMVIGNGGEKFRPELLISTSKLATDGPPGSEPRYRNVLGGNNRKMLLERQYALHPDDTRYKDMLRAEAATYGFTPEQVDQFDQPSLERELDEGEIIDRHGAQKAITDLNIDPTKKLTQTEQAMADARHLPEEALQLLTDRIDMGGEKGTLYTALEGANGADLVGKLIEMGVFTPQERPGLFNEQGNANEQTKKRIERILLGAIIADPDRFNNVKPSTRNKLARIVGPVMRTAAKPDWDIIPILQGALDLLEEASAHRMKVPDFARQGGLMGGDTNYDARMIAMAKLIAENGPIVVARAFRDYAQGMSLEGGLFGGVTPESAFDTSFDAKDTPGLVRDSVAPPPPTIQQDEPTAATPPPQSDDEDEGGEGGASGTGGATEPKTPAAPTPTTTSPAVPDSRAVEAKAKFEAIQAALNQLRKGEKLTFHAGNRTIVLTKPEQIRLRGHELQYQTGNRWTWLTEGQFNELASAAGYQFPKDTLGVVEPDTESEDEELTEQTDDVPEEEAEALAATDEETVLDEKRRIEGVKKLADALFNRITGDLKTNNPALTDLAITAFGGSRAEGVYTVKDQYEAVEAAINRVIQSQLTGRESLALDTVAIDDLAQRIKNILDLTPTQTSGDRTAKQNELQQFSTPPLLGAVVARAAAITKDDLVLEPSAGNGGLAVWAKAVGADVVVNEIDPIRRAVLDYLGFDEIHAVDAEQLNNLLPNYVQPTVVIMNPPFSATGGRVDQNNTKFGMRHIKQALDRLAPGGRLVAILPEGVRFESPRAAKLWAPILKNGRVRANIGLAGGEYSKYGTTYPNRLIVVDRVGPTEGRNFDEQIQNVPLRDTYKTYAEADAALQALPERAKISGIASTGVGSSGGGVRSGAGGATAPTTGGGRGAVRSGSGGRSADGAPPVTGTGDQTVPQGESRDTGVGAGAATGSGSSNGTAADVGTGTGTGAGAGSRVGVGKPQAEPDVDLDKGTVDVTATFTKYKPVGIKGAKAHPANLIESSSMAGIEAPLPTYEADLPDKAIESGALSDVQLESVIHAGQRHEQRLPNGARAGVFIGHGTGVGKTRILAGTILDNWNKGRKRAVVLSVNYDLFEDLTNDLAAIGGAHIPMKKMQGENYDDIDFGDGIVFLNYPTFIKANKSGTKSRVDQVKKWAGDEPVIVFDEAHKAKNAVAEQGQGTQTGAAVIKLQDDLPNARVAYASATGATEVRNMAYMVRLGLWGAKTSFPNGFVQFMNEIEAGGTAALEMVTRSMKALGMYFASTISYEGVTHEELEHHLTDEQRRLYNISADAWASVMNAVEDAIEETNASARAKGMAKLAFYGAQLRFFKTLTTAIKVPSLIDHVQKTLDEGGAPVISLQGTNEAVTNRAMTAADQAGQGYDDLDVGPSEIIKDFVKTAFPTVQYEDYTADDGSTRQRKVLDQNGQPVQSAAALAAQQDILRQLDEIKLPEGALDQILSHFGYDKVAELTGRSHRLEYDPMTGARRKVKRKSNLVEMDAFQSGKKQIAIISAAASTGISLHAGRNVKNQRRRTFYALELPWSADQSMQANGRVHRSNQVSAPHIVICVTDLGGEKRFSATLARRMASLGSLTMGSRDALNVSDAISKYDIESRYGEAALSALYQAMEGRGGTSLEGIPGLEDPQDLLQRMGLIRPDQGQYTIKRQDLTDVKRFMSRVLALPQTEQNAVFGRFMYFFDAFITMAQENGTFDMGVSDIKGYDNHIDTPASTVATDETTGAKTEYLTIKVKNKTKPWSWADAEAARLESEKSSVGGMRSRYMKQKTSGRFVLAEYRGEQVNPQTGAMEGRFSISRPSGRDRQRVKGSELTEKYDFATPEQAKAAWEAEFAADKGYVESQHHIITGALLPVWNQLRGNAQAQIRAIKTVTEKGERVVGVEIPHTQIKRTLQRLGKGIAVRSGQEIYDALLEGGPAVKLEHNLMISKRFFKGDDALMVTGHTSAVLAELVRAGVIREQQGFREIAIIPKNAITGPRVIDAILEKYPEDLELDDDAADADGGAAMMDVPEREPIPAPPGFYYQTDRALANPTLRTDKNGNFKDPQALEKELLRLGVKPAELSDLGLDAETLTKTYGPGPIHKDTVDLIARANAAKVTMVYAGRLSKSVEQPPPIVDAAIQPFRDDFARQDALATQYALKQASAENRLYQAQGKFDDVRLHRIDLIRQLNEKDETESPELTEATITYYKLKSAVDRLAIKVEVLAAAAFRAREDAQKTQRVIAEMEAGYTRKPERTVHHAGVRKLTGGTNYAEHLFIIPPKSNQQSFPDPGHWPNRYNVFGWDRTDDRKDINHPTKRWWRFVQEWQSDWHQAASEIDPITKKPIGYSLWAPPDEQQLQDAVARLTALSAERTEFQDTRREVYAALRSQVTSGNNYDAFQITFSWRKKGQKIQQPNEFRVFFDPYEAVKFHREKLYKNPEISVGPLVRARPVGPTARVEEYKTGHNGFGLDKVREFSSEFTRRVDRYDQEIEAARLEVARLQRGLVGSGPPDVQLKDVWEPLLWKHSFLEALRDGADVFAWTPAYVQAERWSNAMRGVANKLVLEWQPDDEEGGSPWETVNTSSAKYRLSVFPRADSVVAAKVLEIDDDARLYKYVGKSIATTLLDPANRTLHEKKVYDTNGLHTDTISHYSSTVEGDKILVGAGGFKLHYDEKPVAFFNKWLKKYGVQVEQRVLPNSPHDEKVWAVDITPGMQELIDNTPLYMKDMEDGWTAEETAPGQYKIMKGGIYFGNFPGTTAKQAIERCRVLVEKVQNAKNVKFEKLAAVPLRAFYDAPKEWYEAPILRVDYGTMRLIQSAINGAGATYKGVSYSVAEGGVQRASKTIRKLGTEGSLGADKSKRLVALADALDVAVKDAKIGSVSFLLTTALYPTAPKQERSESGMPNVGKIMRLVPQEPEEQPVPEFTRLEARVHEQSHAIQRYLSLLFTGFDSERSFLEDETWADLKTAVPALQKVEDKLRSPGHGYEGASNWLMAMEVFTHLSTASSVGRLGLTLDEAANALTQFYDVLYELHGDNVHLFDGTLNRAGEIARERLDQRLKDRAALRVGGPDEKEPEIEGVARGAPEPRQDLARISQRTQDEQRKRESRRASGTATPAVEPIQIAGLFDQPIRLPKDEPMDRIREVQSKYEKPTFSQEVAALAKEKKESARRVPTKLWNQLAGVERTTQAVQDALGTSLAPSDNPFVVAAVAFGGTGGEVEAMANDYEAIWKRAKKLGKNGEDVLERVLNYEAYDRAWKTMRDKRNEKTVQFAENAIMDVPGKVFERLNNPAQATTMPRVSNATLAAIQQFKADMTLWALGNSPNRPTLPMNHALALFEIPWAEWENAIGKKMTAKRTSEFQKEREAAHRYVAQIQMAMGYYLVKGKWVHDPARQRIVPEALGEAEIALRLANLKAALTPEQRAAIEAIVNDVYKLNREMWDRAFQSGLVSRAVYEKINKRGDRYVPLERIFEEEEQDDDPTRPRPLSVSKQKILFNLQGSARVNVPPIWASMMRAAETIRESRRNQAALTLVNMHRHATQALGAGSKNAAVLAFANVRELRGGEQPEAGYGEISVYVNGVKSKWQIPELLADEMNLMDAQQLQMLGAATIGFVNGIFKLAVTGANLAFAIPNNLRDVQAYIRFAEHAPRWFRPDQLTFFALQMAKSWADVLMKNAEYRKFERAGASFSTLQKSITPDQFLQSMFTEAFTKPHKALFYPIKLPFKLIVKFVNSLEEVTKLTSYKRALAANLRKGMSLEDATLAAAYETRTFGGSPDFALGGSDVQLIMLLYPFFRASLAGSRRTLKNWSGVDIATPGARGGIGGRGGGGGDGSWGWLYDAAGGGRRGRYIAGFGRLTAWLATLFGLGYLLYYLHYRDKDREWAAIPEAEKDRGVVFFTGGWYTTPSGAEVPNHITIPLDHAYQSVWPIVIAAMRYSDGKDPEFGRTVENAVTNLLPLNVDRKEGEPRVRAGARAIISNMNPIFRGVAEEGTNWVTWTDRPIVPNQYVGLRPTEQYQAGMTSPTAIKIAQKVDDAWTAITGEHQNIWFNSPMRVEHMLQTVFGGASETLLSGADAFQPDKTGLARGSTAFDSVPVLGPLYKQLTRRFTGSPFNQQRNDRTERLYNSLAASEEALNTFNFIGSERSPEKARAFIEDPLNFAPAAFNAELNTMAKKLSQFRQTYNWIAERPESEMSREQKLEAIRELSIEEDKLLQRADEINTMIRSKDVKAILKDPVGIVFQQNATVDLMMFNRLQVLESNAQFRQMDVTKRTKAENRLRNVFETMRKTPKRDSETDEEYDNRIERGEKTFDDVTSNGLVEKSGKTYDLMEWALWGEEGEP